MSFSISSSCSRVERIDDALVAKGPLLLERAGLGRDRDRPDGGHIAEGRDAQRGQQLLGQGAGGHAGGRFPGLARSSTPRIEPRYFIDPLRSP